MDQLLAAILDTFGDITFRSKDEDGEYSVELESSFREDDEDLSIYSRSPGEAFLATVAAEIRAMDAQLKESRS